VLKVNQDNERLMEEYERLASDLLEWIRWPKICMNKTFSIFAVCKIFVILISNILIKVLTNIVQLFVVEELQRASYLYISVDLKIGDSRNGLT
jgi:hypothetical protein